MDVTKAKKLLAVLIETVRDAGEVPAGHLYAALMAHGITLDVYQGLESMMVRYFKIKKTGNVLSWTPEAQALIDGGARA